MGDVIKFERPNNDDHFDGSHIVELHIYEHPGGRLSGVVSSENYDYGEQEGRLEIAAALERMAWLVRKECANMDELRGDLLAVVHIHESSAVRVCVDDDKVTTDAQMAWVDDRLDDAKDAIRMDQ